MTGTPIFDQTRDETLIDPQLPDVPALALLTRASATAWMYVPPHLAGPCEDRPPHLLTDDDGID